MTILITGGLGYIGSHTVVELLNRGHKCLVIDNLSRSTIDVKSRIESITQQKLPFEKVDMLNKSELREIFAKLDLTAVIHFAGFKSVNESVNNPLMYYQNNLISTLNLLEIMQEFNVTKLVFSSSATVYGDEHIPPLKEDYELKAPNPYGKTKLMLEDILRDFVSANDNWSIALMRYFNPVGAHRSGLLGEIPFGLPNNLMPHVLKAANKEVEELSIFGGDHETKDGTCIRDFIHIVDLAIGHIKALEYIEKYTGCCDAFNLGTGQGYSVLELVKTFEEVINVSVPYKIIDRRPGDIIVSVANCEKAATLLNWRTKYDLKDMCLDSWKWYQTMGSKG